MPDFRSVDARSSGTGRNDVFLIQLEASALNSSRTITLIPPTDTRSVPVPVTALAPPRETPCVYRSTYLSAVLNSKAFQNKGHSDLSSIFFQNVGENENGRFDPCTPDILKLFSEVAELYFVLM